MTPHARKRQERQPLQAGDLVLYYGHICQIAMVWPPRQDRNAATGRFRGWTPGFCSFRFRGDTYVQSVETILQHQGPWLNDHGRWVPFYSLAPAPEETVR